MWRQWYSCIPAIGPFKGEVYDVASVLKIDGARSIPETGPLEGEVYDVVGVLKIDGGSGIQQLDPSKGRSLVL